MAHLNSPTDPNGRHARGIRRALLAAAAVLVAAGCELPQRAAELHVSPSADTLLAPDTVRLSAEAFDANGHEVAEVVFRWSSGDESVATVDALGLVRGVGPGSVVVTVSESTAGLEETVSLVVWGTRRELVRIYETLGGEGWTNAENWGTDAPLDEWYGVTTDGAGRVVELDLSDNGLAGPVPPELGRLESLQKLDLSKNADAGSSSPLHPSPAGRVPLPFSTDAFLLDAVVAATAPYGSGSALLSAARFRARPLQLSSDPESESSGGLQHAAARTGGGLTGSIPPELGSLPWLRILNLSYNSLAGPIPRELGGLSNLEWLHLAGNDLSGSIPPELTDLSNLVLLHLAGNDLSGSMSPGLGNLSKLVYLLLAGNDLSGSIPPELGNLSNLVYLYLRNNELSGSIPPELGGLSNLVELYLGNNDLSGSMPPGLGNLSNLELLDLAGNDLSGSMPPELGDLSSLVYLYLGENDLSGSLPPELGDLSSLVYLYLGENDLSGSMPPELGDLSNLAELYLGNNGLSGSMPPRLGDLSSLEFLDLYGNGLSGSLPPELGDLSNLRHLYLTLNELSGPIPHGFVDIPLRSFWWDSTLLCAPGTDAFQDWLDSIDDHLGGKTCG